jgi:hypothetical protein
MKFIVLSMLLEQGGKKPKAGGAKMTEAVPFLKWRPGYEVKPKGVGNHTTFVIKTIDNHTDGAIAMTYGSVVELESHGVEGDVTTTKNLKGSTLQSGYEFVSTGLVVADAPESATKPIAINLDHVRNVYPRRDGLPGCRVMLEKVNYVVAEDFERIMIRMASLGAC